MSRMARRPLANLIRAAAAGGPKRGGAIQSRAASSDAGSGADDDVDFGFLFDIDGVIVRGREVLPFAPNAFRKLVDGAGRFRVPTVFVTNAGNRMRRSKAEQLSNWLGIDVTEDQVVMSHSPLKMYKEYHDKHVLVTGQGPIYDIAKQLGFKKVTTMKTLRHVFPSLDAVDHKRRRAAPCGFSEFFPPIEAVVLFGEPTRWETSLQLLIDVLVTDGHPSAKPPARTVHYPHLPVLACNMDLQWMAEAVMPRFGHGAFLVSLENLYKKITGRDLIYTALVGKPSEVTYRHGEHVLQLEARKMGLKKPIKSIYCIGDNVCTDIFGANLYNRYIQSTRWNGGESAEAAAGLLPGGYGEIGLSRSIDRLITDESELETAENCFSVLVETGVFSRDSMGGFASSYSPLEHSPRDFLPAETSFQEPTYTVCNVLEAVELIFEKERFK